MRIRITILLLAAFAAASTIDPQPAPGRRRALLIGINDYSASRLGTAHDAPAPGREWPNLAGAVNDVEILRDRLIRVHGFAPRDVVTLIDQDATRDTILDAIDRHLLKPADKGDVLFLYYAGHGSQVRNSRSDEVDRLDESLVPADSRLGARDIRDKELRRVFNRILDRGALLTVILDACHSGSGARGKSLVRRRRVRRDERDVADSASYGLRPEDRGALIVSAAQDFDTAWERRDDEGTMHGAFSWAWIRAMRDASLRESAQETFLRAQARLRAETPFQEPVFAGNAAARSRPFLGAHATPRDRVRVGIERVRRDGQVLLQGGWANGLAVGSALRVSSSALLTITEILGPGRSAARIDFGASFVRSGALAEIMSPKTSWSLPDERAAYALVRDRTTNRIALRASSSTPDDAPPRYYYVIGIDDRGRSVLVFPRGGSVENRFPIESAESVVSIGVARRNIETFFLVTTDEPLPNPWILEKFTHTRHHKESEIVSKR